MVDLAYVLGQSHALRQACSGADDQSWRGRMQELLRVEAPDDALKARLSRSFKRRLRPAGKASFPSCTEAARAQGQRIRRPRRRPGRAPWRRHSGCSP